MAWPNTTISTSNVDSGSDTPANARTQIYQTITAVNDMITSGPPLGALGFAYLRTLENRNFGGTYKANVSVTFQTGNVVTTSNSDYTLSFAAGTYLVDFVATSEISGDGVDDGNETSAISVRLPSSLVLSIGAVRAVADPNPPPPPPPDGSAGIDTLDPKP